MSEIIICPTGLTGNIRGMKVREERILSDRKLAKSGGQADELLPAMLAFRVVEIEGDEPRDRRRFIEDLTSGCVWRGCPSRSNRQRRSAFLSRFVVVGAAQIESRSRASCPIRSLSAALNLGGRRCATVATRYLPSQGK